MLPCQKCLENNWDFKNEDDKSVTVTCNNCGYTANFFPKKKPQMKHGDFCRNCGRPVKYKPSAFNVRKLLKPYYYTAYYICVGCGKMYMSDKFKITNEGYGQKNDTNVNSQTPLLS